MLNVFDDSLSLIKNDFIREFVVFVLENVPDYFWTQKVSSSGFYHGGETTVEHVLRCVDLGKEVCRQQIYWPQENKDILFASLILHDCWKCGEGKEKYTEEDFLKNKCTKESIGNLKTDKNHAYIGYTNIINLSYKKNLNQKEKYIIDKIANCVRFHMGPWTNEKKQFDFKLPYSSLIIQVHNIDFFETKMSMLLSKKND